MDVAPSCHAGPAADGGSLHNSFPPGFTDDHPVFAAASLVEVRPGRHLNVLCRKEADSVCTLFFIHGANARIDQFEHIAAAFNTPQFSLLAYDAIGKNHPLHSP